jgi:hypothetical protein
MERSHKPAPRAKTSTRAPSDAQLDAEVAAADAAEHPPRTSEGPAPGWASEAAPSDPSPAAHPPSEPPGSPPSLRSFRPLRWDDPADARAWLDQVRTQVADLAALGREGSRLSKHHVLSRAERGRQVHTAARLLRALLDAAEAGLPTPLAEEGEPSE